MAVISLTSQADNTIGVDSPPPRRPEVTRIVRLLPRDSIQRPRSATPYQDQIITWTGPIQTLFGYSLSDVEGTEHWWLDRIHPEDCVVVLESLTKHLISAPDKPFAAKSRICGLDYRFKHANGTYILISDRIITTRDKDGNAVCFEGVVFDKEARRNERDEHTKLLESQNLLALVANNTPSGIFMMDPQVCGAFPTLFTPQSVPN